jgi:hypothetical protein
MIALSFIRMFREGPDVSFIGSPTVSPVTAASLTALKSGEDLGIKPCFSMNFFALSQAPPLLAQEIAIYTPLTKIPARRPATAFGPNKNPVKIGVSMTIMPGRIISTRDDYVLI